MTNNIEVGVEEASTEVEELIEEIEADLITIEATMEEDNSNG